MRGKKKHRNVPPIGSTYHKFYKKKRYTLKVVNNDGKIGYAVGKMVFETPTAAAKSITKSEVNGWVFWKID